MTNPLVSVCLPNLNTRPFLEERTCTIFEQTYSNWELIVSDNFSDDGAWQFFERLAEKDQRVLIEQAPRQGLYPNWNNCLRRARGDYIYIATSDDTMASNCLETMVRALDANPDCDLAHCPLVFIDQRSHTLNEPKWPDCTVFAHGLGDLARRRHIRRAPYDGLIHLTGQHVVLSMTQLLIRRSLFSRIGDFGYRWGSVSDFNWEMKAGLVANMVHVPETWASWRLHTAQATATVDIHDPARDRRFEEMIEDAVQTCLHLLAPKVVQGLQSHWLDLSRDMRAYYTGLRLRRSVATRRLFQLEQLITGSKAVRSQIVGRISRQPKWGDVAPSEIRAWLESIGITPVIATVSDN
jgi:glycosyltransferase involved in cell wall biosynthesis